MAGAEASRSAPNPTPMSMGPRPRQLEVVEGAPAVGVSEFDEADVLPVQVVNAVHHGLRRIDARREACADERLRVIV
jgi:hypothetical protein